MNKKQKKNLARIIVAAVLLVLLQFVETDGWLRFVLYLVPYLVVGYDILWKAVLGIKNRQPLDENLLMAIASVGAIVLALLQTGDYLEANAVMLFYQVGEWFQSYAVGRSRKNICELMDIRPDYANLEREGKIERVDPDEVEVGSVIVVKPGEKVPIDGKVESGESSLNTSALTGESRPRTVRPGDDVVSGCINQTGVLRIRTSREFGESTVSKILELVENASSRKSKSEAFISRFARVYTPIVVGAAVALAVLAPLARLAMGLAPEAEVWIYRALTFLVISCPCALVISVPLSFFAGIGGASREGVLVKGSNYLELLSQARTVVFDKTGTLTKGVFRVTAVRPAEGFTEKDLLLAAAGAERFSTHPIAVSLREAAGPEASKQPVESVTEDAGRGVKALVAGREVCTGNSLLMKAQGLDAPEVSDPGTVIHVSVGGVYAGCIVISDVVKEGAAEAIAELRHAGVRKTVMLTGDSERVAKSVASELGIDEVKAGLLPADKVSEVEKLLERQGKHDRLAFVGDGINDAPVLSRADIGIAMGAMGSDAAIEAADIVLMDDDPRKIAKAIKISRKCLAIVKENIWFAIGVKVACLLLGAVGIANMWAAIFADVGVMILAVLNAIRALFVKRL